MLEYEALFTRAENSGRVFAAPESARMLLVPLAISAALLRSDRRESISLAGGGAAGADGGGGAGTRGGAIASNETCAEDRAESANACCWPDAVWARSVC